MISRSGHAAEAAVGAIVVVVVLPFAELVVEDLGVVDEDAVEHAVELFGVDAVGSFDLAVQPRCPRLDVGVGDAFVRHVPVERRLEL